MSDDCDTDQFTPRQYADRSVGVLFAVGGSVAQERDDPSSWIDRMELGSRSGADDSWALVPSVAPPMRRHSAVVSDGQTVYVLGGSSGDEATDAMDFCEVGSDTFQWHPLSSMLAPRENAAATIHQGDIYAIGGCTAGQTLDLVERFSWRLKTWILMAPLSTPRAAAGAASSDGSVFAVGGCVGGEALASVECFDVVDNEWHSLPAMSSPRASPAVAMLGSNLIVLGGYDGMHALRTCETFDLVSPDVALLGRP